jgi:hypothetical protein
MAFSSVTSGKAILASSIAAPFVAFAHEALKAQRPDRFSIPNAIYIPSMS